MLRSSVSDSMRSGQGLKGAGIDTVIIPVVQMGPLGVHQDSTMMTTIMKLVGRGEGRGDQVALGRNMASWTVHLSSGYLNFPPVFGSLIINSRAIYNILTSAPEANGFYGSKGLSKHIPAAYTFLEKLFLKEAKAAGKGESELVVHEYRRPGWTFHAKGSSNFGQRSLDRDLEAQAVIVTENSALRGRLAENLKFLYAESVPVDDQTFEKPDRKENWLIRLATRIIRSML
ncbi:CDP-diacylglycerol--glycerol-3-phosphate 3-phosphatidyltransferase [Rhizophlyctis rosea]|nr:CDP-diacylglycerol--glycerol-3-phosphate 3-phosphatidyltransferase [Rhizophlyctis rosea]